VYNPSSGNDGTQISLVVTSDVAPFHGVEGYSHFSSGVAFSSLLRAITKQISNQQSRETVVGTSASITVSSVTTLNSTF